MAHSYKVGDWIKVVKHYKDTYAGMGSSTPDDEIDPAAWAFFLTGVPVLVIDTDGSTVHIHDNSRCLWAMPVECIEPALNASGPCHLFYFPAALPYVQEYIAEEKCEEDTRTEVQRTRAELRRLLNF